MLAPGRAGHGPRPTTASVVRTLDGPLQRRAEAVSGHLFLGGPVEHFEQDGRSQLIALLRRGLRPDSMVVDVGCGTLRAGYWLIHFLDPGGYHGIEPSQEFLSGGRKEILEPGLEEAKSPRFSDDRSFNVGVFGGRPDFVLARSVWSHAAKPQIEQLLDSFAEHAATDGLLFASYVPVSERRPDYLGASWVGQGPDGGPGGMIAHDLDWLKQAGAKRDLEVRESTEDQFGAQVWLEVFRRAPARSV